MDSLFALLAHGVQLHLKAFDLALDFVADQLVELPLYLVRHFWLLQYRRFRWPHSALTLSLELVEKLSEILLLE